jgi:hypothetical protein
MIDAQDIIDHLVANNIPATWVEDINTNVQEDVDVTSIGVGDTRITAKNASDVYEIGDYNRNQNGSNLVQGFEIHIVCPKDQFRTTWITVYNLLNGYNPEPREKLHSGLTYNHGGKVSCGDRKYHIDNWNIGFPTNKVLI